MAKKRKRVSDEQYAALLARGGVSKLESLARYEEHVVTDPDRWAVPFGCDQDTMLQSIGALRAILIAETLNASVAAATGV